jgi:hypothetical protein
LRWRIPEQFNIADALYDRRVGSNKTAPIHEAGSTVAQMTF